MRIFPNNVQISERLVAVGITRVMLEGVIGTEDIYDFEWSNWVIRDGENVEDIEKWLDAFIGKKVKITISLANPNEDGVDVRGKIDG